MLAAKHWLSLLTCVCRNLPWTLASSVDTPGDENKNVASTPPFHTRAQKPHIEEQAAGKFIAILHDAGECSMSQPALQNLTEAGYSVTVLALGEPASSIFLPSGSGGVSAVSLTDLGVEFNVSDGTRAARAQLLPPGDVATVVAALTDQPSSIAESSTSTPSSLAIITGTVYAMQAQLARALARQEPEFAETKYILGGDRNSGSSGTQVDHNNGIGSTSNRNSSTTSGYVVGLDDSFALWSNRSLTAKMFVLPRGPADNVAIADELFVTAQSIANGVTTSSGVNDSIIATTTGSPSIDAWASYAADTDQVLATREMIAQAYTLANANSTPFTIGSNRDNDGLVVLVYAGGYGGVEYDEELKIFCNATMMLREEVNPTFVFVFSPHPGYPSSYEKALFQSWGCLPNNNSTSPSSSLISSFESFATTRVENAASNHTQETQQQSGTPLLPQQLQSSLMPPSAPLSAMPTPQPVPVNLFIADEASWNGTDTGQLVAASNGSISVGSTVGGQSLSIGKPHVYTSASFEDVFTAANLIPKAPTSKALVDALNVTFRDEAFEVPSSALETAGVPLNGTASMVARLLEIVA